jgi:hypothetical protein
MKTLSGFLVVLVAVCSMLYSAALSAESDARIKVLVVTGGHGFEREAFFKLFEGHHDIVYEEAVQPKANEMIESGEAANYDVLVLYDMWQPITEAQKKAFVSMLEKGKGLVALHHCLASYQDWPEFCNIIGGKFYLKERTEDGVKYPQSQAAHGQEMKIKVNKDHPLTYGMDDFVILDETYNRFRVAPEANVFLTTDNPANGPKVAWTRTYGNSRVAYIQLGHDNQAYSNPNYRRIVAWAIRWAALPKGLVPLFNGQNLTGWESVGNAKYTVEDGMLVGQQSEDGGVGELLTERSYGDFGLFVDFKVAWPANSGVWFRYQAPNKAYQADVLEWKDPVCWSGTLYCPGKMFLAMNTDEKLVNREGWNTFLIWATGNHLLIFLNDRKVADVRDDTTDGGKIGFQVHAGKEFENMKIVVRSIGILEL